jgi:phosphopantetheinyl transferase
MPIIFHRNIVHSVSVAVWKIAETEEFLVKNISLLNSDIEKIQSLSLAKRRLERLACRHALAFLLQTDRVEIRYSITGAPQITQGFVSFAHSGAYAAAAFSHDTPVGLDLEKISDKITRLYPRFMPSVSSPLPKIASISHLPAYIWCAKEAAYKLYARGDIDFVQAITIEAERQRGKITLPSTEILPFSIFHTVVEELMLIVAMGEKSYICCLGLF